MPLETCIGKGLRLKGHQVARDVEEPDRSMAEIEWIPDRRLICSHRSRRMTRIDARHAPGVWRDLIVRDRPLMLRYAPARVLCPACGPHVEFLPSAAMRQTITKALVQSIAQLSRHLRWKETAAHCGAH